MTTTRRRILRPMQPPTEPADAVRRRAKHQAQLEADRQSLRRWMSKLKRAFTAVDRLQARMARLERQLVRESAAAPR